MSTTLNGTHRCDRCGAQAYVRASLLTSDLLFCGHHYRLHASALEAAGVLITANDLQVMQEA
jgi:hypothetical protein